MDSEYHIFECLPDGSEMWRATERGLNNVRLKVQELAEGTGNDHFAMRLPTREVVFRADGARQEVELARRVSQISYTERLRKERADLLRSHGYGVISVVGNEAAKTLLTTLPLNGNNIAFFMVGRAAPEPTRKKMVDWLKAKYSGVRVALNPPNQQIPGADCNVAQNGQEVWLRLLTSSSIRSGSLAQ